MLRVYKYISITWISLILCIGVNQIGQSQRPDFSGARGQVNQPQTTTQVRTGPDTTSVEWYYIEQINELARFSDTLLNQLQIYNPVEKGQLFYQNLGNVGSAARPLYYTNEDRHSKLDFGFHDFNIYNKSRHNIKLYKTNRAFSNLEFIAGSNQSNFMISAIFSRPFKNDVQLTIDYSRIIQEGFYTAQATRLTNLAFAITKKYKSRDMIITYVSNANNASQNGGITTDSLFNQPFYNFRTRIPTFLEGAQTRHANQEYAINNYFSLPQFEGISFRHEVAYENGSFKFSDESLNDAERSYYGMYAVEDRGIRSFLSYHKLETSLSGDLLWKGFSVNAGINYSYYSIDQDARTYSVNDLSATGKLSLQINDKVSLHSKAYLGLASNIAEYKIQANADIDLGEDFSLTGSAIFERHRPALIQQQAFINQIEVWNNSFSKPLRNTLSGAVSLKRLGLSAEISQIALTNPIYYSQEVTPVQYDGTILISQLYAKSHHRFKSLHMEHQVGLQTLTDNVLNLPRLLSDHELYWENFIFKKKMWARFGVRIKAVESYVASDYSPVIGVFHQNTLDQEPFLYQADAFLSFKVDKLRAFILAENLSQTINNQVFELTNDYPLVDFKLRLGFFWDLYD